MFKRLKVQLSRIGNELKSRLKQSTRLLSVSAVGGILAFVIVEMASGFFSALGERLLMWAPTDHESQTALSHSERPLGPSESEKPDEVPALKAICQLRLSDAGLSMAFETLPQGCSVPPSADVILMSENGHPGSGQYLQVDGTSRATGLHIEFAERIPASQVSFDVYPFYGGLDDAVLQLSTESCIEDQPNVEIYHSKYGNFRIKNNNTAIAQGAARAWHRMELSDIDWQTGRFSWIVNGAVINAAVRMQKPWNAQGIKCISLFNDGPSLSRWDNLMAE